MLSTCLDTATLFTLFEAPGPAVQASSYACVMADQQSVASRDMSGWSQPYAQPQAPPGRPFCQPGCVASVTYKSTPQACQGLLDFRPRRLGLWSHCLG